MDLNSFLSPKSIAVIGASRSPEKVGEEVDPMPDLPGMVVGDHGNNGNCGQQQEDDDDRGDEGWGCRRRDLLLVGHLRVGVAHLRGHRLGEHLLEGRKGLAGGKASPGHAVELHRAHEVEAVGQLGSRLRRDRDQGRERDHVARGLAAHPDLADVVGLEAEAGVGLGGPDIFAEDPGLVRGVYPYYPTLAGTIPLAPSVQHENYYTRRHRGPPDAPSVEELYRFARDKLKANYLFWTRRLVPPEKPYARVLEMLDSPAFPKDPAGGLNTACPIVYRACVH